jgi:hypothetical protein
MSVSESAASRPGLVAPVHSDHIESVKEQVSSLTGNVKFRDIVKIFVDDNEVAELSAEQVSRVRESESIISQIPKLNAILFSTGSFSHILSMSLHQCTKKSGTDFT